MFPYVPKFLRPALNEYMALERRAIEAAETRHRLNQIKLPPGEWAKRLIRIATESVKSSVEVSPGQALEGILALLDGFSRLTAQRAADITAKLSVVAKEPMKPRPRKFRGKQLPKWPYGGRW